MCVLRHHLSSIAVKLLGLAALLADSELLDQGFHPLFVHVRCLLNLAHDIINFCGSLLIVTAGGELNSFLDGLGSLDSEVVLQNLTVFFDISDLLILVNNLQNQLPSSLEIACPCAILSLE